ncbi:uncharacterized protein KIAA1671 homolog [Vombatus ursinus]|uniref:uncharacterized protein KIAA1671 homolog n=1 Tax=Vombatus ursinus TaxID=29139 RepID=UPI000FFD1803|nr:uncharacterized protein KIAA1671 homolog [Vombatus ursinus]XP_027719109.1 uncharacterized protein KIAA1671 homolog [Vombatus ursinus]XP_027719119.1 uncharacterized protein KIAA1671 homolog [Vombatus ursinus]XP_027719125.1 uncharacterized protein KIAA1671 homolog [Vombatus ursinus]
MATRVEVSPLASLTPVPNLNEITKEDKLQTTFYHSVGKAPASPPVMVLAGPRNLGPPSRALPVPRLSPKPFSKENPLDTFANVKSPIASVKPGTAMTRPLTYNKLEGSSAAKALDENMPSLVEPKMDEGGGVSSNVIKPCNKPLPQTMHSQNTIILFETAGPAESKADPSSGKWTGEEQGVDSATQLQGQLPSSKTEALVKPALPPRKSVGTLQRQASLCSDDRLALLKSWEKGEEKEPLASPGITNEGGHPSSETRPRGKRRPVSAIFVESLQHPKPSPLESPAGKVPPLPPEKSWVRKPRPLSVDLTARFENKDILSKKVGSPIEASKEKGLGVGSNDRGNGEERSEPLDRATLLKPTLRLKEQVLDVPDLKNKVKEQNQKIVFKSMAACTPETSTDLTEASVRKGWNSQEEKPKQERDPDHKEAEGPVLLIRAEKNPGLAEGKNRAAEGNERVTERDSPGGGQWVPRGSVKKRVSLFGSESLSRSSADAPEKQKGSVKVQDRIKEWMVESPEVLPESRRRSFQSRPLSADLTKVFTRLALESESRPDKGPAPSGELPQESLLQEKKREGPILLRTDLNGASAGRNQWKPVKPYEKTRQTERKSSSGNETDGSLFPKEDFTAAPCRLEAQSPPTMAEDDGDFQTVWATVFQSNVMRYPMADRPFLTSASDSARKFGESPSLGAEKTSWIGKGSGDKVNVRTENSKWAEKLSAEKHWSSILPDEEKSPINAALLEKHPGGERGNVSSAKQMGNSLLHQRIEPRYDVVHMTGERILSEAVVIAPEEQAMTLRTNKQWSSQKQGSRSEGLNMKQQGRPDVKTGPSQASSLVEEARERLETATPKSEFHEPKDVLGGSSLPPNKIVEKPYLVNQDKGPGISGNEKASRLFSRQIAKEKESLTHVSETVVVRAARVDPYNVHPGLSSVEMNRLGSQSLVEGRSQFHDYLDNSHPRATAKEESFDLRSRKHLGSRSMRKEPLVMGEESKWSQSLSPEPEAKVRKSGSMDLRVGERWRRRTLPHDVKFDEFVSFAPEPAKRLGRRVDSVSSSDTYFEKSWQTPDRPDSKESSRSVLQDAKEAVPKPESPREPRETYFAVTYQIPVDKREYNVDSSVYGNRKASSPDKDEPVSVHNSRKLNFLSESSPNSRLAPSYPRDPSENFDQKNWQAKEREEENLSFSKSLRPSDQPVLPGERRMRHADGRVIDVDALLVNQRLGNASIPSDPKEDGGKRSSRASEHFVCSSKNSDLPTRRKQGEAHESLRAKAEDGYRSSILDIDALMAEYKEESVKGSDPRDQKEERVPASHGGFQRERPGTRSSPDHLSQRYDWRGQKAPQDHMGFRKSVNLPGPQRHRPEESSSMMHSGPEISKEKTKCPAHEPSRQKAPSTKFTPLLWGMPQSELSEQYPDSPSDAGKKRPAEDEKKDVASAHRPQNTECWSYRAEANTPLLDIKNTEVNVHPKTSPTAHDATLFEDEVWAPRNSVGKREKAGSLHGRTKVRRGGYDSDFGNIKRTYSEKTAPASVRENLSLMQEARERRRESLKAQKSFESTVVCREFPLWETKSSEDNKVPQDTEKERVRPADNKSPLRGFTPTPVPRRSHSFCKDRKIEPFMDQLKQCFSRQPPEAKDTDTLVQESDSQYGTWNDPRQSGESFAPETPSPDNNVTSARKQPTSSSRLSSLSSQTEPASPADAGDSSRDQRSTSLDRSSTDLDSTDGAEGAPPSDTGPGGKVDDFSFINQTSVLDSSALKARAQLSKRNRRRAPISHSLRRSRVSEAENPFSLVEETDSAWMFKDSTEEKSVKKESSDEEEKPSRSERTPVSQPQRLPVFPGVDPSVLKAQLRKRNESDSPGEVQASAQLSKSPKSPFQPGVLGSRVLPSSVEKEERSEETSPQWLKDLKSKKRQSQYENQA